MTTSSDFPYFFPLIGIDGKTAAWTSLHWRCVKRVSADREASTAGKDAGNCFVNCVKAGNRTWTVGAARTLRGSIVQSLPEQVRSPLPPWDNVYFRELFLFLDAREESLTETQSRRAARRRCVWATCCVWTSCNAHRRCHFPSRTHTYSDQNLAPLFPPATMG